MEREILFRGKRIEDGKWVEGYLLKYSPIYEEKAYILPLHSVCVSDIEVDPKTICQYTGLTDKAGRRFEGDIFQASDGDYIQRYVITWNEDSLEWSAECIGDPDGTLPLCEFKVEEIEVVGNIFDNPELLRGA